MINIQIENSLILYLGLIGTLLLAIWRWFYYKEPIYIFSSFKPLANIEKSKNWHHKLFFLIRLFAILFLVFAIAGFRIPDERTKIPVQGVDIMLVIDVSGSMNFFDDINDQRTRFEVAKAEALRFINLRDNDPIGIVFFASVAISRVPLTLDKTMLANILNDIKLGTINPNATVLSKGILVGLNKIKNSKAKSKILIVLTDGEPTTYLDVDPKIPIELAKKLGVKIYTIGIGSEQGGYFNHPFYGLIQTRTPLNVSLLEEFAKTTGGQFFRAEKPEDLKRIYDTIDKLEKTEYEIPLYGKYYEFFMIFLWLSFLFLIIEIILSTFVWLSL